MLRFRRMRSLQTFAAVHGQVHNPVRFAALRVNQERTLISRQKFAPRTFGSRTDVPPQWPNGVNPARPEQGRVGANSETILVCLAAPIEHPDRRCDRGRGRRGQRYDRPSSAQRRGLKVATVPVHGRYPRIGGEGSTRELETLSGELAQGLNTGRA